MLHKCDECGCVFSGETEVTERHPEVHADKTGMLAICPDCGSDYVKDGNACVRCGGFTPYGDFCTDCLNELDMFLDTYVRQPMQLERDELEAMIVEWIER